MRQGTLLVVGAGGDVGIGIVTAAIAAGWRVVAAGRNSAKLARFEGSAAIVTGDLSTEAGAAALWDAASAHGAICAVALSVNAPNIAKPILEWQPDALGGVFATNVLTHFIAAKTFLPRLPADGAFIGIGGGTVDFIIPNSTQLSVAQAAQRMLYRGIARENRGGAAIRELIIVSMVNGESKRDRADESWVTDVEVGRHVCAVLADPAAFPGPILSLKSREQVGQPDLEVAR
jgi:NAD(P)-dependent dehydrogenase (short-subunit alcohol dehydrogenase family)